MANIETVKNDELVKIINGTESTEKRKYLDDKLKYLKTRLRKRRIGNRLGYFSVSGLFFCSIYLEYFIERRLYSFIDNKVIIGVIVIYAILLFILTLINSTQIYEDEIKNVENEIEMFEYEDSSIEQRAEKQFKVHQYDLKRYYDQSLRHSSWIFVVGIVSLIVGFAIIGYSLYMVNNGDNEKSNIVIASLGGVAGLLTNFIGVIYLKMYSETVKSSTEFHNRLVFTHHLHFGNVLLSKIENKELREHTLSQMALSLVKFEQDNDSKETSKKEK